MNQGLKMNGAIGAESEFDGHDTVQVCKYIDIPLQHISNLTLLSMNRPPREHTEKLLQKLRDRIPGLVLRTTFISGFPGMMIPPPTPPRR